MWLSRLVSTFLPARSERLTTQSTMLRDIHHHGLIGCRRSPIPFGVLTVSRWASSVVSYLYQLVQGYISQRWLAGKLYTVSNRLWKDKKNSRTTGRNVTRLSFRQV